MKTPRVHQLRDEIAVVGWSCRLPGANSIAELWTRLLDGHCAITRVPEDRFSLDQFGHPRRQERGKSYSWAAGILDDIWGFDPAVFGISPREAVQIDPQQRILLQLTWEALEDAGIRPSTITGSDIGVFIGASQTDYGHAFFGDPAIADAHFAPGTALAILANRISYIFGLHGPSITVDTACSSSLVALHQAVEALNSGRIDTAIVGGSNLIASPASFIAFSQANMLSTAGLCQAFSAKADGFVRAEGAVVLVLRKAAAAQASRNPVHGVVLATDLNSDGRTNGISLPNLDAQQALLDRIYARHGIDHDKLAFVEAHGTGTPVGDPVEATAIGRSIGVRRSSPLPIGSIKTNIGHLEPASGLAGVLKALLALNHGILPPSLHFDEPSPHIEFDRLNLTVCAQSTLLPNSARQYAGVNSFGFGGTNAHAVVGPGRKIATAARREPSDSGLFGISANSPGALAALAGQYVERVAELSDEATAALASAVIHRRDNQANRIVVASTRTADVVEALKAFAAGKSHKHLITGTAAGNDLPVAFVFSGNGGQWPGMGLAAYRTNKTFRERFDEIDALFQPLSGWSLKEALASETLHERLSATSVAQPLIFAIQCACTAALRAGGLQPAAVLGHSVGEVAAAEAAGILDLRSAVKVIYVRSKHQELTQRAGRMMAVLASADAAQLIVDETEGVEIAAINSPRAVTIAGSAAGLERFKSIAAGRSIASLDLDLDYPFHTALMAPVEAPLRADLRDIRAAEAQIPFVSTVTGDWLSGPSLGGEYWWRNVREPVLFADAVRAAAKTGARVFIEIGPRGLLLKHIADSLQGEVNDAVTLSVLERSHDDDSDPIDKARANAVAQGAQIDTDLVFGPDPGPAVPLPHYPWQQTSFRFTPTSESANGSGKRHPFAGVRGGGDGLTWQTTIDTALFPALADHVVGGQTIFPGTGFIEIALAVASQWLRQGKVVISSFEIVSPLDLSNGDTRHVTARVSPGSSTIEILSRPRLSEGAWSLHCRGKMRAADGAAELRVVRTATGGEALGPAEIYALAGASGLHYGPAFQLVDTVTTDKRGIIDVALRTGGEATPFLLDPMRHDACAHGFFALFPKLRAAERGVTYIPVRLDEIVLHRPGSAPARATIEIVSATERAIVGHSTLYDDERNVVATLRNVRSQAVPIRRLGAIENVAMVELAELCVGALAGRHGVAAAPDSLLETATSLGLVSETATSGDFDLLEGWALAAAHEIAAGLAKRDVVDLDALVGEGRLPDALRPWMAALLARLTAAQLATQTDGIWTLQRDATLPPSRTVVRAMAAERPSRAAELLLAAAMSGLAEQVRKDGAIKSADAIVAKSALDFDDATSARESSEALARILGSTETIWPGNRALRVLQLGAGPLAQQLIANHADQPISLTVFEPDPRRYGLAEAALSQYAGVTLVDGARTAELTSYDLIVSAGGLHRVAAAIGLPGVMQRLAPGGLLAAVEPAPSLFRDLVFGTDPAWFLTSEANASSPLRSAKRWLAGLGRAGEYGGTTQAIRCGEDVATLLLAQARPSTADAVEARDKRPPAADDAKNVLLIRAGETDRLTDELVTVFHSDGIAAHILAEAETVAPASTVIMSAVASSDPADPAAELTRRCLAIKSSAERIGSGRGTLWLLFNGALDVGCSSVNPVEAGAWAFSRTLANEFPKLDVRRIDVAPGLSATEAAGRIQKIFLSDTKETELHIGATAVHAVRVLPLKRALEHQPGAPAPAARLERTSGPSASQRVAWVPIERRAPDRGEIEIEVLATGLNFRDLMWSMGLLPEDMLEDGFSGATLGLECAGRVIRTGDAVRPHKAGDLVLAFAASAFSTHVTIKAGQAVTLPPGMSPEAAATVPVAFFTAYYSLVTLARLARREWVLIHGGAGAVGMAAIQIAQSRGARIIATAGSTAKRELMRSLGVDHVLDSRSTSFADDVRNVTKTGVHVVLNSLAGDAMERSIDCLRPFGRFVELGKRDYVANTHIGLRPFRKNLSYFGVDVDQLIGGRNAAGKQIFGKIMRGLAKGTFRPLPYSVFDGERVASALQLMQQAHHVGKLVIRPPQPGAVRAASKSFAVSADRTHIITGAFGGFGLETAKWLAGRGARHLVMVGRRGAATPEAQAAVRDLADRGVNVLAEPCDITDLKAAERMFESIRNTMPPVAGVMHAAMVLDDAILANLDEARFARVVAPKVAGAENLDALTRCIPLDYFVLFSSVTTLIGNPGQGNYVAANAYMEGVARRRRRHGLPALAVGWGPIIDVGVVAQNKKLQTGLQKLTGVTGMRARDALELLARALEQPGDAPQLAVMTIAPNEGGFGADRLAVLRSPTYAGFIARHGQRGENAGETVDIPALLAREGADGARRKLATVIAGQVARVLHAREDDVSLARPLAEIGLDSLMALELVMNLEKCFGMQIPLAGASGSLTIVNIADEIIAHAGRQSTPDDSAVAAFAGQHRETIEPDQIAALKTLAADTPKPKRLLS